MHYKAELVKRGGRFFLSGLLVASLSSWQIALAEPAVGAGDDSAQGSIATGIQTTSPSNESDASSPNASTDSSESDSPGDAVADFQEESSKTGKNAEVVKDAEALGAADEQKPAGDSKQDEQEELSALDKLAAENEAALPDGTYYVRASANSNAVFDAANGGTSWGTAVQLYSLNFTNAQKWTVSHDEKGYVTISNASSGLVLDVMGANAVNSTGVQLYGSNSTLAQKWVAVADGPSFKLVSALDERYVLDARGGSTANGTRIQIYSSNDSAAQRWSFQNIDTVYSEIDGLARAHAADAPDGEYLISSALSASKVLDVSGGSTVDSANVQIWSSNMTGAQRWVIAHDAKGYATITNEASGKVLDVAGGSALSGTNVAQYGANDTRAQKWIILKNTDGSYSFQSALWPGLVLDVSGASTSDGANIQTWSSNGSVAQKFSLISAKPVVEPCEDIIPAGWYEVVSSADGSFALDVSGASSSNGANIQTYARNSTFAQLFRFEYVNGYYRIVNAQSGKCLDVAGGNLIPSTNVQQWDADGQNANQLFSAVKNGDGTYSFINKATGLAVDVWGGRPGNAMNIDGYTPNGTAAQRFNLIERTEFLSEGVFEIRSAIDSGKVLDVSGGSTSSGANVQLWQSNGSHAQKWLVSKVEGEKNIYTVESLVSGMRLACDGNGNVVQCAASTDASQYWSPTISNGCIVLKNVQTAKVLDVANGSNSNGANVQCYASNGTVAQRFQFVSTSVLSNGTYFISMASSRGMNLDVCDGSFWNGANVQLWQGNDSGAQKWDVRQNGDGSYTFLNSKSGRALDVANASAASGANVQQWESNGSAAQRWFVEYAGNGGFKISSALNRSLVLDVSGGSLSNGSNIQIYADNGSAAQRFAFSPTTYSANYIDLGVPFIGQNPELPTGCESVALTNMLLYYGFSLSKTYMADVYIPRSGSDFVTSFWGNPHYSNGNCVSAPGITSAANNFLRDRGSALRAYDVTGSSFWSLYDYVQKGHPVIIWSTMYQQTIGPAYAWQWYNGRQYATYTNSHTVVLEGFNRDSGQVILSDSLSGRVVCDANWANMLYTSRGSQAVVIK